MARKADPKKGAAVTAKKADGSRKAAAPKAAGRKTTGKSPKLRASTPVGKPAPKRTMAKAVLEEFHKILLDKRHDLVGDMTDIRAEALQNDRSEGSGLTHPADIGTDSYEQEFTLELLESERALLGEINEALERVDNGTYGICLGTGTPISKARLRAKPWAKYCIEYAQKLEAGLVPPVEDILEDGEAL